MMSALKYVMFQFIFWHVNACTDLELLTKPVVFGENVQLACAANETEIPLDQHPSRSWSGGPLNKILCMNAISADLSKYYEVIGKYRYEYILVIKNFSEADVGCEYKCIVGVDETRKTLQINEEDYEYIPPKETITVTSNLRYGHFSVDIHIDKVWPTPECEIMFQDVKYGNKAKMSKRTNGKLYSVDISLKHTLRKEDCTGEMLISCEIGTKHIEVQRVHFNTCPVTAGGIMIIHRTVFVTQVFCMLYTYTNADTLYIKEGSNTTLLCPFKSTIHKAQWVGPKSLTAYSDGSYLKNTLPNYEKLRITGNYRIGEYNLEINKFSAEDEGLYRCNNINGSTAFHVDYYLEIYRSPSNISVMNTSTDGLLEVNEGQSSQLLCSVDSGNPPEDMKWVHNDSVMVFGGPTLLLYEFVPVVDDHLQIYICFANNSNTEVTVESQVQLYVRELPYTTIQPVGSTVIEAGKGKDIVLQCEFKTNVKPYKLVWTFNNDTILSESSDKDTLNGTLHITNLSRTNTGNYRCNVYNTVGLGNAEVDVLVTYKPELALNPPFVFNTEIGKPANISIPIRSFENPTASWTLLSEENLQVGLLSVKETQKDMFVIEGRIVPSTHPHFGKYGISVRNRVGSVHADITLDYTDTRVLTSPRRYICSTGFSTTFNCIVNTNLYKEWSCVWQHLYNDEFIRTLPCNVKDGVSRLHFEFCNYMDTGIYKCILETPTWNFSSDAELSIKGPPIILKSEVNRYSNYVLLSTYFVSHSPAKSISWFLNDGQKESLIKSKSTIFQILSTRSSADMAIYDKKIHINCIRTDLKLFDSRSVKKGWFVCLIRNRFGSSEKVFNTTHNSTFSRESLTTTDSHREALLYSSMYPTSEVNNGVIDPITDSLTVIFLIGGLTLFVALTLAGAMWQYKSLLKGTTTIQTDIQISNGVALQNVRRSTLSDDIYEEICNENSEACPPSISGQEVEGEIDDKRFKIAEDTISAPYINVYEDLGDVTKERNQNNSDHYKTIRNEMPLIDRNSDDENYLIPGPAYMIVIDPDQEKEAKTCNTNAYKLII